jgi:hypothetical protein
LEVVFDVSFIAKQSKTIEPNHFASFDVNAQAAGMYKPKIQVPRQPMKNHISKD